MFKNYLLLTIRTLFRNRSYSIINILGLSFGLTCFILIGLYLFDELTFDRQHKNFENLYRVVEHKKSSTEDMLIAAASYNVAKASKEQLGEVENSAVIARIGRAQLSNPENNNVFLETATYANNAFMEMFDFKAVDGNVRTSLSRPNSIVLTKDLALKLFGDDKVVGKSVKWEFMPQPFQVTAVIADHPKNSSFNFDVIYSQSTHTSDSSYANFLANDWASENFMVFTELKPSANPEEVADKITDLVAANYKENEGVSRSYRLQPIKEMHLNSDDIIDGARNNNVETISKGSFYYIRVFAMIALFVLLIACVNYMNLTTAKASNRSKEIGVRKASGAFRYQLIHQFLMESVVITGVSFILAIVFVNSILPPFNHFTGKTLSLGWHTDYRIWGYAILATLLTGLISGSYPAFILSGYSPVSLLKNLKINQGGNASVRRILVVFQFAVSVVMIIATLVLFQQIKYINKKDLGFSRDLMVVVDINSGKVRNGAESIINEFSKIPSVQEVSTTSRVPGEWKSIPTVKVVSEGSTEEPTEAYFLGIDENFLTTYDINLISGRAFQNRGDTLSILLNRTAAEKLKIKEAAGQLVEIPERSFSGSYIPLRGEKPLQAKVVGIVQDFNYQSLRQKIQPLVLGYKYNPVQSIDYFTSRIDGNDIPGTLKKMEQIIASVDPDQLFEYHFLDQQLALFYQEDARRQQMLIWSALATLFIACLGLFGLAAFTTDQRTKEIGIRKVLGASVASITTLLSRDFIRLVVWGILIGSPLAFFFMRNWLQDFAYHISLHWTIFLVAGLIAIAVAFFTVYFQSLRAALVSPAKSLQDE